MYQQQLLIYVCLGAFFQVNVVAVMRKLILQILLAPENPNLLPYTYLM